MYSFPFVVCSGLNTSFKCSPWGTAERKADDFGADDDVNQAIMTDIKAGQEVIEGIESEDDLAQAADDLEKLIDEIEQEIIITYLRSVVRYAYRMDGGAALELAAHEFDDLEDLKGQGASSDPPLKTCLQLPGARARSIFPHGSDDKR